MPTSSLLHMNGADASTTFTDVMGKTWTPAGNAQLDTAQKKFGTASGLFDGDNDGISTPDHADFAFVAGDFTIEGFFRTTRIDTFQTFMAKTLTFGWIYLALDGNNFKWWASSNGSSWDIGEGVSFGGTVAADTWYHVAFVRSGNTWTPYFDGNAGTGATNTASLFVDTNVLAIGIGSDLANSEWWGWIDEVRITKGVAIYTTNFTPPTQEFSEGLAPLAAAAGSLSWTGQAATLQKTLAQGWLRYRKP